MRWVMWKSCIGFIGDIKTYKILDRKLKGTDTLIHRYYIISSLFFIKIIYFATK
jgi:hypothetical protein